MFFREIPTEHANMLKRSIGLMETDDMPPKAEQRYWETKRCCDRIGVELLPNDIAQVAVACGYGKPTKKENEVPTVVQLWRKKQIKAGHPVIVQWLDGEREATLKQVVGATEVVVLLDGDPEERTVAVERVVVPAMAV